MFPAFKEWHPIVEALGSGEQILILRKGGISEKHGGFDAAHAGRFWLFPTLFHAQSEKTKSTAARFFSTSPAPADGTITLRYFADITHHVFLSDWATLAALDPHHFWTESAVREKFDWAQPSGIHAFVVRVHRLPQPFTLPLTTDMGGCKSWINLAPDFSKHAATPVLDDSHFAAKRSALGLG